MQKKVMKEITEITCDLCGLCDEEIVHKCIICNMDICTKCYEEEKYGRRFQAGRAYGRIEEVFVCYDCLHNKDDPTITSKENKEIMDGLFELDRLIKRISDFESKMSKRMRQTLNKLSQTYPKVFIDK